MAARALRNQASGTRSSADSGDAGSGRKISVRQVVAGALIVLAVVFIVENREQVEIRLIVPVVSMPLWAALASLFVVGGIAGLLLARRRASRRYDRR